MMKLENWALFLHAYNPYRPTDDVICLEGIVSGSSHFDDGAGITTSRIVNVRQEGETVIATTYSGSEYILGEVDPEYEELFPGAKQRLLAQCSR